MYDYNRFVKDYVSVLSTSYIEELRKINPDDYQAVLNEMTNEFDSLNMSRATAITQKGYEMWNNICKKLEGYYKTKHKSVLFPLFVSFNVARTFEDINNNEYITGTRRFLVKNWNGLYYVLPIENWDAHGVYSVIPPQEFKELIPAWDNPTLAMMDFFVKFLKEVHKQYGSLVCEYEACKYCYEGVCRYDKAYNKNPNDKFCNKNSEEV